MSLERSIKQEFSAIVKKLTQSSKSTATYWGGGARFDYFATSGDGGILRLVLV